MTYDEIITEGRARALDFGSNWPSTPVVLRRRVQVREQELFTLANRANPDYFGINVVGVLNGDGDVTLKSLEDPVGAPGLDPTSAITRVEILDPGTHPTLQCGDEVTIVSHGDWDAGLAPRMWLRNFILHPIPGDMDGVVSVCVYYGYRPQNKATPIVGTEVAELPDMYQQLLVLDVARFLVKLTLDMNVEAKAAAGSALAEEIQEMQGAFLAEVVDYAGAQVSRFGSIVGGQRT